MKKLFSTLLSVLLVGTAIAQSQPQVIFTGTPYGVMGISSNNRYICGTKKGEMAYRFDIETKELITIQAANGYSDMCASDIMNDGTLIGINDEKHPSIYKDEEWQELPYPAGEWTEGLANQCSADGKYIIGHIQGKGSASAPYRIIPSMWERQDDGSYKYIEMPNPQTDFLGGKTQFISLRTISADGNIVTGVMMEQRGFYSQAIIYRKGADGQWTYETPFVEYSFNMSVYDEWKNKEPKTSDFITSKPDEADYKEQVNNYLVAFARWQYQFFTAWKKGPEFTSVPLIMSDNGKYLAPTVVKSTYSYEDGDNKVETTHKDIYPCLYNIETKELTMIPEVKDFVTHSVSNYGDMLYSDNENIFLLMHDTKEKVNLTQWLNQNYNGFELTDYLPENVKYLYSQCLGSDMSLIVGSYLAMNEDGGNVNQEVFCVKIPVLNAIMQTLNTPSTNDIFISGDKLVLKNTTGQMDVFDMAGRKVLSSTNNVSEMNVSSLPKGVYVVSTSIGGSKMKAKVYKK